MGKSQHNSKDIVRDRSGGQCERCSVELTRNVHGVPDGDTARSIHHRQPQRCGGRDSVINMVNLCIKCHREIHEDEDKAALDGWIILDRFPGKVPFLSWQGWVLPREDGSLVLLDFDLGRTVELAPAPAPRARRRVAYRQRHRKPRARQSSRRVRAA